MASALGSVPGSLDPALDKIQAAGGNWVRVGAPWSYIDRDVTSRDETSTKRDWAVPDSYVAAAKAHDQTMIGAISQYAKWANGRDDRHWVPADTTEFTNFTRDVVTRYRDDVDYWEIWNEENWSNFWTATTTADPRGAALYAKLLRESYLAIKALDPTAKVVLGGLDRNDVAYLNALYAELKEYEDADEEGNFFHILGVHPYADDRAPEATDPSTSFDRSFSGLPKMKAAMAAQGDTDKHIMVTEIAWVATAENAEEYWAQYVVGETVQADYLRRAYMMAIDKNWDWLDAMLWYGFKNLTGDPPTNTELPFSLVNDDLSARPSYDTFSALGNGTRWIWRPDTSQWQISPSGTLFTAYSPPTLYVQARTDVEFTAHPSLMLVKPIRVSVRYYRPPGKYWTVRRARVGFSTRYSVPVPAYLSDPVRVTGPWQTVTGWHDVWAASDESNWVSLYHGGFPWYGEDLAGKPGPYVKVSFNGESNGLVYFKDITQVGTLDHKIRAGVSWWFPYGGPHWDGAL